MEVTAMRTASRYRSDLRSLIHRRDPSAKVWSIHVDQIEEWRPRRRSFKDWFNQLCAIFEQANAAVADSGVVAVTLNLAVSSELELFQYPTRVSVDFFTPPNLYVLQAGLEFPPGVEEYYRVLERDEIKYDVPNGVVIARSSRSFSARRQEFDNTIYDNTIYIASRFG
jgi:hypothetical protein